MKNNIISVLFIIGVLIILGSSLFSVAGTKQANPVTSSRQPTTTPSQIPNPTSIVSPTTTPSQIPNPTSIVSPTTTPVQIQHSIIRGEREDDD